MKEKMEKMRSQQLMLRAAVEYSQFVGSLHRSVLVVSGTPDVSGGVLEGVVLVVNVDEASASVRLSDCAVMLAICRINMPSSRRVIVLSAVARVVELLETMISCTEAAMMKTL
jgi:hypothetical protein